MSYVIETGIPVPRQGNHLPKREKSELRLAIEGLMVGQSLVCGLKEARHTVNAINIARKSSKELVEHKKFVTRAIAAGARVWRTE